MLEKLRGFDWDKVIIPARTVKREKRWKLFGRAPSGRFLVVVFTFRRKLFRTVTAYEMNAGERRHYAPQINHPTKMADWYATPQGRQQTQREFARALKDGILIRSAGAKIARTDPKALELLMQEAQKHATRSISLRIPIADLEQARQIAEETGVGYQTVLKRAIRSGLKRAG